MTYNITLTANHQSLTAEYLPLAAESVQYLTAKVVCETEDWTGREIKAMFGQGCTVHEITVTGGEITAKQQLNLTAGDWRVWLVGNSARDGEVIPRITTNVAHISVAPTGGTEGNPFPVIPPTAEEQLRADMGDLADLTTEDKSSLVAAINEAAASGGSKDAVTYTPQTLTDEQQKQARINIGSAKEAVVLVEPTPQQIYEAVRDENTVYCCEYKHNGLYIPENMIVMYPYFTDFVGSGYIRYRGLAIGGTDGLVYRYEVEAGMDGFSVNFYPITEPVSYGAQSLSVEQQAQARTNIGAEKAGTGYTKPADGIPKTDLAEDVQTSLAKADNAILCTPQSLTDEIQEQARTNIGAYTKPASGIPKSDLADDVQTSLNLADKAISLGLTSATPGQIIKVKAVRDGKPTEWEAVDMPLGGSETWEKLYDGTIQIEQETMLIEVDIPRSDSAKEFQVYLHFAKNVAQEWDSKKVVQVYVNGSELGYFIIANKLASDYYFFAKRVFDPVGRVEFISTDAVKPNYNVLHVLAQLQNGQGYEQKNTGEIRISFAAAYAGSIELLVYGRY